MRDRGGLADALTLLADALCELGDLPAAQRTLEESLAIQHEIGNRRVIAHALAGLGKVAREKGDAAEATRHYRKALLHYREMGAKLELVRCLENLAVLAFKEGEAVRGVMLAGATDAVRRSTGTVARSERARLEKDLETVRLTLSDDLYQSAWTAGQGMDLEATVSSALSQMAEVRD